MATAPTQPPLSDENLDNLSRSTKHKNQSMDSGIKQADEGIWGMEIDTQEQSRDTIEALTADHTVSSSRVNNLVSYKDKLLVINRKETSKHINQMFIHFDFNTKVDDPKDCSTFIPISAEDKQRIYKPWIHYLIIKVFGRKIGYRYLLYKWQVIWKLSEELKLIDL